MTTKATSTAKKTRTATGHIRLPELQRLRVCLQLRTTGGVPHAKYQLLVALLPCSNRLGDTIEPTNLWKHTETEESAVFWEPLGATLLTKTRVRNFIHPVQFGIFPKRLSLQYLDAEILSGYEEDLASIRDGFSAWVKSDPETIL